MTFSYRAPDDEDYDQGYPIIDITLDCPWNPRELYDDVGSLVLPVMKSSTLAQLAQQVPSLPPKISVPGTYLPQTLPAGWYHAETFTLRDATCLAPPAPSSFSVPVDATAFYDCRDDLPAKLVYGRAFHLGLNWDHMSSDIDAPPVFDGPLHSNGSG